MIRLCQQIWEQSIAGDLVSQPQGSLLTGGRERERESGGLRSVNCRRERNGFLLLHSAYTKFAEHWWPNQVKQWFLWVQRSEVMRSWIDCRLRLQLLLWSSVDTSCIRSRADAFLDQNVKKFSRCQTTGLKPSPNLEWVSGGVRVWSLQGCAIETCTTLTHMMKNLWNKTDSTCEFAESVGEGQDFGAFPIFWFPFLVFPITLEQL